MGNPRDSYQDHRVVDEYDRRRFYSLYDRFKNRFFLRALTRRMAVLPRRSIVVDIPCGTGRIDDWLLRAGLRVVAADVSLEMLNRTRRQVHATGSWLGLLHADASALPLRSKSIDGAVSIRFFHLLDRTLQLAILAEFARVSRELVVVEYACDFPAKAIKRTVLSWLGRKVAPPKITRDAVWEDFSRCGLSVDRERSRTPWFSASTLVVASLQPALKK